MTDTRAAAIESAQALLAAGQAEQAFAALRPHVGALREDAVLAVTWARLLAHVAEPHALTAEIKRFARTWPEHPDVALALAEAAATCCAREMFDTPRAADGLATLGLQVLGTVVDGLGEGAVHDPSIAGPLHMGLARVAAQAGWAHDETARRAFRVALAACPEEGGWWLERARFHLHRRRWALARAAAREAVTLLEAPRPAWWLAAIAATAEGDAEGAARAWQAAGQPVGVGPDRMPAVAGLEPIEVQLSARTAPAPVDAPYVTECVWVQPQSPCHGRLRVATVGDQPADFDDVVLWDTVPLGFRTVDGRQVPRFAALAVLARGAARTFRCAGVAEALPDPLFVHPHHGVSGKLVVPAALPLDTVPAMLPDTLAVPALYEVLNHPGAARERRRYARLNAETE